MSAQQSSAPRTEAPSSGVQGVIGIVSWLWVGIPFVYGLVQLIAKIPALFSS